MGVSRSKARMLAEETLAIIARESYEAPSGETVSIAEPLAVARRDTVTYPPDAPIPTPSEPVTFGTPTFTVANETTLEAAHRLAAAGDACALPIGRAGEVCLLNFASAKNPGGGFKNGSRAQEESLARSSGLFACLDGQPMYAFHRERRDALYTDYAIYSPQVPVFRDDAGTLLESPYTAAIITAPAPNAGVVLARDRSRSDEVQQALARRIDRVLAIARYHGHAVLILGAWGCGVFENDPVQVARLFADALRGRYRRAFAHVAFAVLDRSKDGATYRAFENAFQP